MLSGGAMQRQLMYVEGKSQAASDGRGRIGWVQYSKSCRVYHYAGRVLRRSDDRNYNCYDAGSGEPYLVAQPKANGCDKLHGGFVDIDSDAREEYWHRVRSLPDCVGLVSFEAAARIK